MKGGSSGDMFSRNFFSLGKVTTMVLLLDNFWLFPNPRHAIQVGRVYLTPILEVRVAILEVQSMPPHIYIYRVYATQTFSENGGTLYFVGIAYQGN